MRPINAFQSWGKVLAGKIPMLSIEITRECPLKCPGCYAYGDAHLGEGGPNLKSVSDFKGDDLVNGIFHLVDKHEPLHVSLVGGEPMMRHKELERVLPELSRREINTLLVTSAVIPLPEAWKGMPKLTIAVSVDGNPEDHDIRRKPATYERILRNIEGHKVNIHWTIVRKNIEQPGYMDRYLEFWSARPEVRNIWISTYTPQIGEESEEKLTPESRLQMAEYFRANMKKYPKLLMHNGIVEAFLNPPESPEKCIFSKLSVNYTADLNTRVEPCVFGGAPNCAECGCSASVGFHWVGGIKVAGPLRARHLVEGSLAVGRRVNRFFDRGGELRWNGSKAETPSKLVQIGR